MLDNFGRLGIAILTVAALGAATVTTGHADPAPAPAGISKPGVSPVQSPADIARGKALFTGTCGAYCHHPSASGPSEAVSDAPSLFDCDWIHGGTDAQIFHTISHGVEGTRMVAFGGAIPDADIWHIIAYLRSASQCKTQH